MRKLRNDELNRKTVEQFKEAEKIPLVIVLDNIRSAINVGSVFRTADSFLVPVIYLCGITAFPPNKEIQKSALGAVDSVSWKYFPSTIEAIKKLKSEQYKILAIEQAEQTIDLSKLEWNPAEKAALIFGNEISGVSDEVMQLVDACIEIPQFGTKHSLNLAVCAGIVIYRFYHLYK